MRPKEQLAIAFDAAASTRMQGSWTYGNGSLRMLDKRTVKDCIVDLYAVPSLAIQ